MFRFITPPDAAVFTFILGIVMVLFGREIGGSIVVSASLGAFTFFEWWLYYRKPLQKKQLPEVDERIKSMMYAAEQWEKSIIERERTLDEREKLLNQREEKLADMRPGL